jgi:hypothetical protein
MPIKVILTDGESMYDDTIKFYFGLINEILTEMGFTEILLNSFGVTKQRFDNLVEECNKMILVDKYTIMNDAELYDYLNGIFNETEKPMETIIKNGGVYYLKYFSEYRYSHCPDKFWNGKSDDDIFYPQMIKYAIKYKQLDCLKYLHENGCKWDDTCWYASFEGNLECLKYAHENGCKLDEVICITAAGTGNLECLKYAHENGCKWRGSVCHIAAVNGHLSCLKYAYENGCELNEDACDAAYITGHIECFEYIKIIFSTGRKKNEI